MRRALTTANPCDFDTHDHVAWCGDGPEPLYTLAVKAFSRALTRGERLLFAADGAEPARFAALGAPDALIEAGTLELIDVTDAYADSPADTHAQTRRVRRAARGGARRRIPRAVRCCRQFAFRIGNRRGVPGLARVGGRRRSATGGPADQRRVLLRYPRRAAGAHRRLGRASPGAARRHRRTPFPADL